MDHVLPTLLGAAAFGVIAVSIVALLSAFATKIEDRMMGYDEADEDSENTPRMRIRRAA